MTTQVGRDKRVLRFLRDTAIVLLVLSRSASADTVTIAVASNFVETAEAIVTMFETHSSHRVKLMRGSSGRLYAQIVNGAPVDVFLSADADRPKRLVTMNLAKKDSQMTYAIGQLVVWSRDPAMAGEDCRQRLHDVATRKVAIANPLHAPYGVAAREYLQQAAIWDRLQPNLVFGENIAQVMQFVASGNASIGIVARSQTQRAGLPDASCETLIPANLYSPLNHDAVIVGRNNGRVGAAAFITFLQSDAARALIRRHGYRLPDAHRAQH